MESNLIFLAQMEALQDSRNFTIRKKIWKLTPECSNLLHWHDYYEIEFITGGEGTHFCNGETYSLRRGCIYLLGPSDFHSVSESDDSPLQLYNINFSEQMLPVEFMRQFDGQDHILALELDEKTTQKLEQLMAELLEEYDGQSPHRTEMMVCMFQKFIIHLLRQSNQMHHENSNTADRPNLPVNRIISYLKKHFREHVSLSECARMVHLTPNYLGELFHISTGMSFRDYVKHLRFDYAVNLLNSSPYSVDQISNLAGFQSASYFTALFRLHFSVTPSRYRQMSETERIALMQEKFRNVSHFE